METKSYSSADYYRERADQLEQRLSDVKRERDTYQTLYYKLAGGIPSSFVAIITAIIFIFGAVLSHAIRSDVEESNQKTVTQQARTEYLKSIQPLSPSSADVTSQCDAGKAFVGYRNGTGRALAVVDFEVRGYLPNRVSNIVETTYEPQAKDGKAIVKPDANLDRIVQPGDSFSECVKLNIEHAFQGHPELGKATYKVKPVSFKFLDEFPGYVQDQTKAN